VQRTGGTQCNVTPLPEQHRIVAKVDELMALCDELEAAQTTRENRRDRLVAATLHRLNIPDTEPESGPTFKQTASFYLNHLPRLTSKPEHVQQLRQTILNLAVRGKLVEQDPGDEPAEELFARLQREKVQYQKASGGRKEKPLPPIDECETPFALPPSWIWARIGDLALHVDYGTSFKSRASSEGTPVLKMGDIQGGRVILGGQKTVPNSIDDLPRLFLKHKDLLYNRTNSAELVGKTGIFLGADDEYTFASYLIRIRFPSGLIDPVFANLSMQAPYFRQTQVAPQLKQQCGQANVNGSKLKRMIIPVPPVSEQLRIVAMVRELMTLCDRINVQYANATDTLYRFLDNAMHNAPARVRHFVGGPE
jgi:type I restriction enzyme S subunit